MPSTYVNASRIPNILAIGDSPRLMDTLRVVVNASSPTVDFVALQPDEAALRAARQQVRTPLIAFLEWKSGREGILQLLRQADPANPLPIWLLVRPGESPGLDGLHVSGSLIAHAEMDSLESQLTTLMDYLKICIFP